MEETVGIRQVMWLVMLESAKDRILGVDVTPTFYKNNFFVHIGVRIKCISICSTYEKPFQK
jgi:hypothetical protein